MLRIHSERLCFAALALRAWLIVGLLAVGLNQSVPKQTDKPHTNQDDGKHSPTQVAKPATKGNAPLSGPSPDQKKNRPDTETKQPTWSENLLSPVISNWPLILVAIWGILVAQSTLKVIARQALSMRRQTTHLKNSVIQARNAARAAKSSTDALIASERAWIDGELVCHHDLGIYRYTLKIRNLGRTPAQIRSYEISVGPFTEKGSFTLDDWSSRKTMNLHIFLGSGETEPLEQGINMDEIFPTNDSNCMWKAPYRVAIRYADVVTGTPEDRPEHLTSFVYLYWPFLHSTERLSVFNQYT